MFSYHSQLALAGYFGFNGPLRHYFSLHLAISQRGRKKTKKIDERKKCPKNPTLTYCKRNRPFALLLSKLVGRPGTKCLLSTITPPDHPPHDWTSTTLSFCENNKLFGNSIKRLFDIHLKNKIKKKSERKESERRKKRREAPYYF